MQRPRKSMKQRHLNNHGHKHRRFFWNISILKSFFKGLSLDRVSHAPHWHCACCFTEDDWTLICCYLMYWDYSTRLLHPRLQITWVFCLALAFLVICFYIFLVHWLYIWVCMHALVSRQGVWSWLSSAMWVPGIGLRQLGLTAGVCTCWVISPPLLLLIFFFWKPSSMDYNQIPVFSNCK